ncbi:unnamed protein product [Didymodactylos carnosus]|uniref:PDZ domain-containing protein n=1 Tax=Didymodactylos carnosus TaxID=1234261 RepID=A0A8S2CR48_9BILA|nr:unnamed protein product [Didymodactylos carnosus]CAF3493651.1 unnamed protein product [Didymodactylos carnosus]
MCNSVMCIWHIHNGLVLFYLFVTNKFVYSQFLSSSDTFFPPASSPLSTLSKVKNLPHVQCITNGALAGSIIGTLIFSCFVAFLTYLVYLRPKFQELHSWKTGCLKSVSPYFNSADATYDNHCHANHDLQSHTKKQVQQQIPNDTRIFLLFSTLTLIRIIIFLDTLTNGILPLAITDVKFGTYPFRQALTPNAHHHQCKRQGEKMLTIAPAQWFHRTSSFRSMNIDQDNELIEVELISPDLSGLGFNIVGNMRAGIYVKDVFDKGPAIESKLIKSGDRIMSVTVCFESVVFEDALTILSYASPYPVLLRLHRSLQNSKRTTNAKPQVTWQDDFEEDDNKIYSKNESKKRVQQIVTEKSSQNRSKKRQKQSHNSRSSTTHGARTAITTTTPTKPTSKGKIAPSKRSSQSARPLREKPPVPSTAAIGALVTGITSSAAPTTTTTKLNPTKKMKSVTDAVIAYLHYKGSGTGGQNSQDPTASEPYYDSPYECYYGAQQNSHTNLNKNNNNNASDHISPIYTVQLTPSKQFLHSCHIPRKCKQHLSRQSVIQNEMLNSISIDDISTDTYV